MYVPNHWCDRLHQKENQKMRYLILITTYQRKVYLEQLITSIITNSHPCHTYHIAINDDGSTDGTREYMKRLEVYKTRTGNITFHSLYTSRQGGHFATNSLLLYAESLNYDFAFKMDDDIVVIKKGWEDLYYNHAMETGYHHLVNFSEDWNGAPRPKKLHVESCQGALFTFTPEALEAVGFFNDEEFGRRGHGHIDFTYRMCRNGYNRINDVADAPNSKDYVKLHGKRGYVLTPNYGEELEQAKSESNKKAAIFRDPKRIYQPLTKSPINYFFDHIYVLNLPRRTDKRARVESTLKSIGITNYEFFDGIDGSKFHDKKTHRINPGELGCYLSHVEIMKDALSRGFERILIFEDDIIPHKYNLHSLIYGVPKDWDIMYLGASDWNFHKNGAQNTNFKNNYYKSIEIDGTFAYALTRKSIEKLVPFLSRNISRAAVDTAMHSAQHQVNTYVLYPMLFVADISDSDIRGARNGGDEYLKKINWNKWAYQ